MRRQNPNWRHSSFRHDQGHFEPWMRHFLERRGQGVALGKRVDYFPNHSLQLAARAVLWELEQPQAR